MYQVDTSSKNQINSANKDGGENQEDNIETNRADENIQNKADFPLQRFKTVNDLRSKSLNLQRKEEIVKLAKANMVKRFRYNFTVLDILYNFLWPLKCFRIFRKSLSNPHTRYKLFERGEEKLMKEFDAIEFARNQRKLKMLTHWLLDTSERFMAIYQKTNAINLNTETEHELSDDPMYTRVPRLFSKKDKIDRHSDLINKFFVKYLKEVHTEKDINLLHGVVSENELNQEQMQEVNVGINEDIERKYVKATPEENKEVSFEPSSDCKDQSNRNKMCLISSNSDNDEIIQQEGGKGNATPEFFHKISERKLFIFPKTRKSSKKGRIRRIKHEIKE